MPIFEYRCEKCGHVFERFTMKVSPATRPACPKCAALEVERVLSAFTGRATGGGCATATTGGG